MYFAKLNVDPNMIIVVIGACIVGFFTLVRGRADVWKSNYEGEKISKDELQKEKDKVVTENTELKQTIAKLESQPNLEGVIKMMKTHEERAAIRSEAQVKVLTKIAKSLDNK